jgi:hypothetical protein
MTQKASVTWLAHKTALGLPPFCVYRHPSNGAVLYIQRGMRYFYLARDIDPDEFNCNHGVTKAQAEAMYTGALRGWHVLGADPANYDREGRFVKRVDGGGEGDVG